MSEVMYSKLLVIKIIQPKQRSTTYICHSTT